MKFEVRIFIDKYETTVRNLKRIDLKPINDAIIEYIQNEKLRGVFEMEKYKQPVVINATSDFMKLNHTRITLNPFGFHNVLEVQFDFLNTSNNVCNCDEVWCEGDCGTLDCGCVDYCSGKCGMNDYDSY